MEKSMGNETIFTKIIKREIPSEIVYETENVFAFRDIRPQAPVHVLIIPKKPIRDITSATAEDKELLGEVLLAATQIAKQEGVLDSGYRLVVNNGKDAGQEVFHLHFHLLAGRKLAWPPG